jgi:hypothetical protein
MNNENATINLIIVCLFIILLSCVLQYGLQSKEEQELEQLHIMEKGLSSEDFARYVEKNDIK